MNVLQELQTIHQQIRIIDIKIEQIAKHLDAHGESAFKSSSKEKSNEYEAIYPLLIDPGIFKGKKPTGIIFGESERVNVGTWKKVFQEILKRCNDNTEMHVKLMNLRGKVSGRDRVLLSDEAKGMRSPLMVSENLYVETHYDTETLLRILVTRILNAVDYDCSKIYIAIRNL